MQYIMLVVWSTQALFTSPKYRKMNIKILKRQNSYPI